MGKEDIQDMTQFGPETDKMLDDLSRTIGESKDEIEILTRIHDGAWDKVFETFDEFGKENKEGRFVASDGHYLYKQPRKGKVELDVEKLKSLLTDKQWKMITERKVNSDLLEAAVQTKAIDPKIVDQCITTGPETYARIRGKWTKKDKEMYG